VALVITLLVLTLLLTIILEFNLGMRVEARAAANFRDDMKAYYLARSGITFAIAMLEDDSRTAPRYDSLDELWAQKIPPIPVGDGLVSVTITDEDSKINANKLAAGFGAVTGDNMRAWMVRFLDLFELKSDLSDTIADWIDQDDTERPNGAESGYYEGLEESYEARNRPLDSLLELRLIKGMEGDTFDRLKNMLTVNSDGWINVNTASKQILMSLSDDMNGDIADEIMAFRTENPFQTKVDVKNNISISENVYTDISKFIEVKSNYFSITSAVEVNQNRKTINAVVRRQGEKVNILYWRIE
ncbi:MAG: type II secretion system minor pseudopilin GspK, partial [Nitrospirae bacterium]|nr:type II secretion system minor pseudopilin GspK [Nitrospirota bacterium]